MTLMRHVRTPLLVLAAAALAACDQSTTGLRAPTRAPGELAPLLSAGPDAMPGRYVVVMNPDHVGTESVAQNVIAEHGGELHFTYRRTLNGFAASLSPAAVDELRRNPGVRYVAPDAMAFPDSIQTGATWGLDRIDQRALPLDGTYTSGRAGQSVSVYVIDTGIRTTHADFGGRASVGVDFVADGQNGQDCQGHGTHVAGTVAGARYGVAKQAQVVAVRVFGCTGGGPLSTVVAAVEWVTNYAQKPAVANMSLGGSAYAPLTEAVRASVASGVVYTVSAGNSDADACTRSPANAPEAITVGSTTRTDDRSHFSNWGTCLDLFAPGSGITSASIASDSANTISSGTSMATPHVAGVAALYLQGNPTAAPATVSAHIVAMGTTGAVVNAGLGSPNKLLFSGLTAETPFAALEVNPGELTFNFVRPVAGTAASGAMPEGSFAPAFATAGEGEPKAVRAGAAVGPAATANDVALAKPVLLSNVGNVPIEWEAAAGAAWLAPGSSDGYLLPGGTASVDVAVNASGLALGSHNGQVTFANAGGTSGPVHLGVTVHVIAPLTLTLGRALTGRSGQGGSAVYYALSVPAGAAGLTIGTSGGSGDVDMHVSYGEVPSDYAHCSPYMIGNNETCSVASPPAGTYYVLLYGADAYAGVTLAAYLAGPPPSPGVVVARPHSATSMRATWADTTGNETGFTVSRRTETAPGTWGAWAEVGTVPANTNQFTQTVTAGTTYQYRVRACNGVGCSSWSAAAPSAVPTSAPAAPFGAAALATGPTRATVTWTDGSTNEASFSISRSLRNPDGTFGAYQAAGSTPADSGHFIASGLVGAGTYRFQVKACNVAGCSAWAPTGAVTLPTLPTAASGVTGVVLSGTAIRVNWTDASTNEASFRISRAVVSGTGTVGAYTDVATVAANQVTFASTGLAPGTTYRFQVRACNAAGCAAAATSPNVAIPPAPAAPTGFRAAPVSPSVIRLTWVDVSGETSYSLTRALRNPDGTWGAWSAPISYAANTALVDDTGLLAGRAYRYQLRACNLSVCSATVLAVGTTPAS